VAVGSTSEKHSDQPCDTATFPDDYVVHVTTSITRLPGPATLDKSELRDIGG